MAKKGSVVKVRMESEAGTGYRYYKRKNPKNMTEKMRMKRYDPWAVDEKQANEGCTYGSLRRKCLLIRKTKIFLSHR